MPARHPVQTNPYRVLIASYEGPGWSFETKHPPWALTYDSLSKIPTRLAEVVSSDDKAETSVIAPKDDATRQERDHNVHAPSDGDPSGLTKT